MTVASQSPPVERTLLSVALDFDVILSEAEVTPTSTTSAVNLEHDNLRASVSAPSAWSMMGGK